MKDPKHCIDACDSNNGTYLDGSDCKGNPSYSSQPAPATARPALVEPPLTARSVFLDSTPIPLQVSALQPVLPTPSPMLPLAPAFCAIQPALPAMARLTPTVSPAVRSTTQLEGIHALRVTLAATAALALSIRSAVRVRVASSLRSSLHSPVSMRAQISEPTTTSMAPPANSAMLCAVPVEQLRTIIA